MLRNMRPPLRGTPDQVRANSTAITAARSPAARGRPVTAAIRVDQVIQREPDRLAVAERPEREQDGKGPPEGHLPADRRREPSIQREVPCQREEHRDAVVDVDGADEVPGLPLEREPAARAARPHAEGAVEERRPAAPRTAEGEPAPERH